MPLFSCHFDACPEYIRVVVTMPWFSKQEKTTKDKTIDMARKKTKLVQRKYKEQEDQRKEDRKQKRNEEEKGVQKILKQQRD